MTRYPICSLRAAVFAAGMLAIAVSAAKASSMPPTVNYTVTGSSNDWTLDFTVDNNTNQDLYFFGVELPATDVTGAPSGLWCTGCDTPWSNAPFGGSSISYNNVWIVFTDLDGAIGPGQALGGFTALDTADSAAPTSVPWFAYTASGSYTGSGNFNGTGNPGFEGTAAPASAVPEPTSTSLLFVGIVGVGLLARWKRLGRRSLGARIIRLGQAPD